MFPEYDAGWDVPQRKDYHPEGNVWIHQQLCIEKACDYKADKLTKFAGMVHDFGKSISYNKFMTLNGHEDAGVDIVKSFCQRLKIPNEYRDIGVLTTRYHTHIHNILGIKPSTILRVFDETKALIKTERFNKILLACKCDAQGRGEPFSTQDYPEEQIAKELLEAVRLVDTKAISAKLLSEGKEGLVIGNAIHQAKIKAIKDKMRELKNEFSKC
ncbi:tRNA nucleotidyltransferase/poly(A) polymerase [Pseudaeromonas phage vB_PpeM_ KLEP7]|nr:tRNA nucleotidyltransferase/poly(A) polymerase [Pseudaeromonas phage vB_PpeM_ KLEP7]